MGIRIGINGFGRIGRLVLRSLFERREFFGGLEVVAINDLVTPEYMAYMLRYDSAHGVFPYSVEAGKDFLEVGGKRIRISSEASPELIDWGGIGVDYVVESTGLFLTSERAEQHLVAGAKRVVMSAPSKDDTPIFVLGVNEETYDAKTMPIISNASCTTNCLAPVVKVLHGAFGVEEGLMTTVHAVTASQKTVDGVSKKDWRGGRSSLNNIIPSSTGAAKAVGRVIPDLAGRLSGISFRVPLVNVSVVDFTCRLKSPTSYGAIKELMREKAAGELKGIMRYAGDPIVSQDCLHDPHTSIFDAEAGMAISPTFVKVVSWYDNEWGYANKVVEMMSYLASREG